MFRRKFWLSLALTVPIVVTSEMVMEWFRYTLDFPGISWVGPVLGTAVFLYGGWPFLVGGVREVRDRAPGMMLLISMAITVAYVASLATTFGAFDLDFWWELAALVTIMLLGHWQEMKAIGQAQGALAALAALLPDDAERVTDDRRRAGAGRRAAGRRRGAGAPRRPGARRRPGRRRRGRAGRVDDHRGVAAGRRSTGDRVVAGTVATDSAIRVRVDAVGDDTALAGIQRLVAQAQASSGRAQVLADRFAKWLFYIATAAAAVTFVAWALAGNAGRRGRPYRHGVGHRLPARPRPGDPTGDRAVHGRVGAGRHPDQGPAGAGADAHRRHGPVRQDRHADQRRAQVTGVTDDAVLPLAAAVEADSEHPLAKAIVRASSTAPVAVDFRSLPGRGVQATIDGTEYAVGGPALLRELGVSADAPAEWEKRGAAVLYLVRPRDKQVVGALALEDEVRPEARAAIAALRALGVRKIAMITGDSRAVASAVGAVARAGRGVRGGAAGRQGPGGRRPAGARAPGGDGR